MNLALFTAERNRAVSLVASVSLIIEGAMKHPDPDLSSWFSDPWRWTLIFVLPSDSLNLSFREFIRAAQPPWAPLAG